MAMNDLSSARKRLLSLRADELGVETCRRGCWRLVVKVGQSVEYVEPSVMVRNAIDELASPEPVLYISVTKSPSVHRRFACRVTTVVMMRTSCLVA